MNEEWWIMMGKDPDRPLDGPFDTPGEAIEFARQHYYLGDSQLIRMHDGGQDVVASTDPNDLS